MKILKKILALLFLSFGLPFSFYALWEITNPATPTEDREGAVAALLILTLPFTAIGGWLAWDMAQEQRRCLIQV